MTPTPNDVVNDPRLFAAKFLKILNKDKKLVPLRWNRAQEHFHNHRTGRDLVLKARQLGFSTYIQAEMFRRKVTSTRATVTMAHDKDTTQMLRRMEGRFYDNCKFGDIQPARTVDNAALVIYDDYDSEGLIVTAGGKEKGRGGTYTDFHGSEVAFWRDAESVVAGAIQGGRCDVVLESTPNGAQGYFYNLCMDALRGDGVWTLHFYAWWWDDEYRIPLDDGETIERTDEERNVAKMALERDGVALDDEQIKWRRKKKSELKRKFYQEYPEDPITCFLTSGNSYFGDISDVFTAPLDAVYNSEHKYVAGLDFGQTNDYTAMIVIDKTTKQMVDLLHIRRLSWREQRRRIVSMYKKWHCELLVAESNSIGTVNIEKLADAGLRLDMFATTNVSKADVMSDLYDGLHDDGLRLQDIGVLRQELLTFVSKQTSTGLWRLEAEKNGHDDTVISLALAWRAVALDTGSIIAW